MGLPRHGYSSGLPFLSPGDLPDPGTEPRSPALQADSLPSKPPGKALICMDPYKRCNVVDYLFVFLMYINDTVISLISFFFPLKIIFIQHYVVDIYAFLCTSSSLLLRIPQRFWGKRQIFFSKSGNLWCMTSS